MAASNVTDTSLTLTWDAVSYSEGIEHYEIYRDGNSMGTRKGTSFSESGLTADTTYQFEVKAVGTNGLESELSDPLSVTTQSTPPAGE